MTSLRTAAIGAALLIAVSGGSRALGAQQPAAPRRQGPVQVAGVDSTLTAAQKAKIDEITKKYEPQQRALFEAMQGGGDRAELLKRMNDLRGRMQPEIRAVLTPGQQAIFDRNVEEITRRMTPQRPD